jgi:hypothetical protein
MRDEFVFHTAGGEAVERIFYVDDPGHYELDFLSWDVGGGHNASTTVPFTAGDVGSAEQEKEGMLRRLTVGRGSPTPTGGEVSWEISQAGDGRIELEVVGVDGRCVKRWSRRTVAGTVTTVWWDGKEGSGRMAAAGKYYLRVLGEGLEVSVSEAVIIR